jgi:hypothetical protein
VKVPCSNTIQLWAEKSKISASTLRKKSGSVCTMGLPQNTESVRRSFIRSPRRSARGHTVGLGMSDLHHEENVTQGSKFSSLQNGGGARVKQS